MNDFVLDAYAARSCPVKTQNAFLPGLDRPEPDESLQELFAGGSAFKSDVLRRLIDGAERVVDCRALRDQPHDVQAAATLSAMADGVPVIVGGLLPLDRHGHRSGRADVWIRGDDAEDGGPGYHPVMVKLHRMLERQTPGPSHEPFPISSLTDPSRARALAISGQALRLASREPDLLQLAHYWRLLGAARRAASGIPYGGIIGSDQVSQLGNGLGVAWVRLDAKQIRTFSRTAASGWTKRSALERYDHEHAFRVKVATVAQRQTGSPDDPPLVVMPIRVRECDRCVWWQTCLPKLGDDDLSLRIAKSPLDVREIAVLRRLGVSTLTDLASVELDSLLPSYIPEVAHRPGGEERLRIAAHRAKLMVSGVELERLTDGSIEVPRADIEIDFDIETSADDHVYLWGFLVTDTRTDEPPRYIAFSDFSELTDSAERRLADEALSWLHNLVTTSGASVRIYHYSRYEVLRIQRLAEAFSRDPFTWASRFADEAFFDLFEVIRSHFFGTYGLGLKQVAHAGSGFSWRDDNPGGLNSQSWFADAVHAETEAVRAELTQRVLDYNEDDVRATYALRRWLRDGAPQAAG
ncbi:MAG TPA: TM0106 family RecB-like putative nuclease [Propionibacteriaceae bacterium]